MMWSSSGSDGTNVTRTIAGLFGMTDGTEPGVIPRNEVEDASAGETGTIALPYVGEGAVSMLSVGGGLR